MSIEAIQHTQSIYAIIDPSILSPAEQIAEKVANLEFPIPTPPPQSPQKRKKPGSPTIGSPMGLPITSPEKKAKYGKIISPHRAHDPRKFDNTHNFNSKLRNDVTQIRRKTKGHTWEVGSPLKDHPTRANPDEKGRIEHHSRRYEVHQSPSPSGATRLFPKTGRHLIRMSGEDAAETCLAYRNTGSNETFEQYLIRTCTERARQNPSNGQDLETTGLDFLE
jgi:hypothetical protein